jgi:hypothetical protein
VSALAAWQREDTASGSHYYTRNKNAVANMDITFCTFPAPFSFQFYVTATRFPWGNTVFTVVEWPKPQSIQYILNVYDHQTWPRLNWNVGCHSPQIYCKISFKKQVVNWPLFCSFSLWRAPVDNPIKKRLNLIKNLVICVIEGLSYEWPCSFFLRKKDYFLLLNSNT